MFRLDYRYQQAQMQVRVLENPKNCACELTRLLWEMKHSQVTIRNHLARALEIYRNNMQSKLIIEAMLLAKDSTIEKIADVMDAAYEMIDYYKHYFFDTDVLEDNFAITDYVSNITDKEERITKVMALTSGFQFVAASLIGGDLKMNSTTVNKMLQTEAYKKLYQCRGLPVTSNVSKEALKWAAVLKSSTDFLHKVGAEGAAQEDFVKDFRVIFEHQDEDLKSIANIEGEVLRG